MKTYYLVCRKNTNDINSKIEKIKNVKISMFNLQK